MKRSEIFRKRQTDTHSVKLEKEQYPTIHPERERLSGIREQALLYVTRVARTEQSQ
jgi:hypothetical protein